MSPLTAATVLAALSIVGPAQDRHIGFVLDVMGRWTVDGRSVTAGQAVPPGARVRYVGDESAAPGGSITIVLLDNQALHVSCESAQACRLDRVLPSSLLKHQSAAERLTDAALALFGRRPDRYVPAITRGAGGSPLDDAVVRLSGDSLDLGPCFARVATGLYDVQLAPRDRAPGGREAVQRTINWNREHPEPIAGSGVAEGLYELTISSRSAQSAAEASAWVLVLSESRYARAALDYGEVVSAVQNWDSAVPQSARRAFLRASLESLGEEGR